MDSPRTMESLSEITVTLVTSDQAVAALYGRLLRDDIRATVRINAEKQALVEQLRSQTPPDLVIIDQNFDHSSGEALALELRADANFDRTPVMVITLGHQEQTPLRLLSRGVNDFVERTAAPSVFVARTKTQLRHKVALDRMAAMACERDVFAAGVLHDIRNMEASILAICEFTRRKLTKDPVGQRLEIVELLQSLDKQAGRLGKYAADVIQSVRAASHKLQILPQDLIPVVEWVASVIGTDQSPGFTWESPGPLVAVQADPAFIKLILLNILQNAVKYRRPEVPCHIVITQDATVQGSTGIPRVITRFRDNGKGIPSSELRKVFEPFVRGSSSDPADKGSGLGLSLVVRVVTKMGGRVWAEAPASVQGDPAGPGLVICLELPGAAGAEPSVAPDKGHTS